MRKQVDCDNCKGKGVIEIPSPECNDIYIEVPCPVCKGTGKLWIFIVSLIILVIWLIL